MKNKTIHLIALIVITLGCWLTAIFYFGSASLGGIIDFAPVWLIVFATVSWLFTSALAAIARKTNAKVWVYTGLLVLTGWFLPASTFVKLFPIQDGEPFGFPLAFTLLVILSIALILVALLLYSGLNLYKTWQNAGTTENGDSEAQHKHTGRAAAVVLALSVLLLAGALYKFYWFMIWDTTNDGLGYLWLPVPILAVLSSGLILFIALSGGTKVIALFYLLLIPAMIGVSISLQRTDFRKITEQHAEQVSLAIEDYHTRKGYYPQDLQALVPRHFISIPRPVIIYGQDWCYNGSDDYFRLGYIDRQHWSAPHFIGRIYLTKGEAPDLNRMCEQEAVALQKRHPEYPYEYWVEGK